MEQLYLIYTTFPDLETARELSAAFVKSKLAACANILSSHEAIYEWDNEIKIEKEYAVLYKTTESRLEAFEKEFTDKHPYDVPCFVAFPIKAGHDGFLKWIIDQT
jgi:periplasmic divalent cation tolerance protein